MGYILYQCYIFLSHIVKAWECFKVFGWRLWMTKLWLPVKCTTTLNNSLKPINNNVLIVSKTLLNCYVWLNLNSEQCRFYWDILLQTGAIRDNKLLLVNHLVVSLINKWPKSQSRRMDWWLWTESRTGTVQNWLNILTHGKKTTFFIQARIEPKLFYAK